MKKFYISLLFLLVGLFGFGQSTEVGVTEGELSVSLTGAANYKIPIAVPPGINGVVPQISLTYNSQGGNGVAGYGWNISGISVISRIPATKFHDNIVGGINIDENDRFALDGQRLIVKNGTNGVYGANGTVYETESFSNIKVTSFGVNSLGAKYGPAYFLVEYPDGSKAYYGNSSDSFSATEWGINYWENPQGVRISYSYTLRYSIINITSIKYGSVATGTPINEIQFVYSDRQRADQSYIGGLSLINNRLLKEIKIIGNNVGFRNYILGYDQNSLGYDRLINVTEKNGDSSKSYNPTVFTYDTAQNDELFKVQPSAMLDFGTNISRENTDYISGDFDSDGKTDLILYPTIGNDAKKQYSLYTNIGSYGQNVGAIGTVGEFEEIFPMTFLSLDNVVLSEGWTVAKKTATSYTFSIYGKGSTSSIVKHYDRTVNFPLDVVDDVCNSACKMISSTSRMFPKKILTGDFNGDGLTDVIALDLGTTTATYCGDDGVKRCVTQSQTLNSRRAYFIDLRRDNTQDFLIDSGNLVAGLDVTSKIFTIDFNGDGKSDFIVFDKGFVKVYTLDNNNKVSLLYQNSISDPSIVLDKTILIGDFNGDGKMDFVIPQAENVDSWNFYFSNGTSFNKLNSTIGIEYFTSKFGYYGVVGWPVNTYSLNEGSFIPNDFNGDGKTDILVQQNFTVEYIMATSGDIFARKGESQITKLMLLENKGCNGSAISFNLINKNSQIANVKRFPIPVFTNHNKRNLNLEYSLISDNAIRSFNSPNDNRDEVLLKKVTNGNGVIETINYQPLKTDSREGPNTIFINSANTEKYPNTDIIVAPGFQVVTKLEKQSSDVHSKQLFAYYGAVANYNGLGFLGFRGISKTNWFKDDPDMITSISRNDISLRGANIENYSILGYGSANYLPTTYITKSVIDYNTVLDALLPNKVFKIKNNRIQQFNGLDNTSSETSVEYDDYNNPLKSITLLKESATTVQTTVSSVSYNPPIESPYTIGRPSGKNQSISVSGDMMTSEEQYFYENSLLTKIKKKGTDTDYITEDNLYDAFGNIIQKTITATGLPPRITSYGYDSSGRFLTSSKDIEGLSTTFDYNLSNGLLSSEINPYGLKTSYLYDSWFKKTTTIDYLGKKNSYTYTRSDNKTIITSTADDDSVIEEIFDDLGRKIKEGSKNINGIFAYVDYLYDIYDRNYKVSEPYFGVAGSQWNETIYDIYGRIKQSIAFTGKVTDITYSGLSTTVNDGIKTKTSVKNAIGNVVSVTDAPGGTINYTYFANGNLKQSDYAGVKIAISQDGWGRKTKLEDSSAGIYTYDYNGFGEITSETTPNGIATYILDAVGKVAQKTINGINTNSKTTYDYDSSSKLLLSSKFEDLNNGANSILNSFTYDASKRISNTIETTPYAVFTKEFTYDDFGRVNTETSTASAGGKTSSKTVKNTYKNGTHWQIIDNNTSAVLWQANTVNARGQLKNAQNGPLTLTNNYDDYGFIQQLKYDKTSGSTNILTLNTVFDPKKGNLTQRNNTSFNFRETFNYDVQDRLIEFTNEKLTQEKQIYDAQGRIIKNNLGTYNYDITGKPFQNSSIVLTADGLNYYYNRGEGNKEDSLLDDMESETGWSMLAQAPQCISFDSTKAHSGNKSVRINTADVAISNVISDTSLNINNPVNTQYTFSGWIYTDGPTAELSLFEYTDYKTGNSYEIVERISTAESNKWMYITKTVFVPVRIKSLRMRIGSNGKGNVWFDDIQIAKTNKLLRKGQVRKEDFFSDDMEERTGWATLAQSPQCISFDNTKSHAGNNSLKISIINEQTSHVICDTALPVNNTTDVLYTFSGWVYTDGPLAELTLFAYTGTNTGYNYNLSYNVGTTDIKKWIFITKTVLVSSNIKNLRIRVCGTGKGNVWFDDVQIAKTDLSSTAEKSLNIAYNAFKSPVNIDEPGIEKISFDYNDFNSRTAMFYGSENMDKLQRPLRKYYSADGTMEIKQNNATGELEFVTYIGGDGYSAPIVVKSDGTTQTYLYLQRDYQGSILSITDANGAVLEKRVFDAWGNIVSVKDGAGVAYNGLFILDRGYTGHEHLQSVGLINMNGRIYDPKLHRFLQPDNFVQDPFNTQNYNRYGYVLNNPLKYTDPSGEWLGVDDLVAGVLGGLINLGVNIYQGNIHNFGQGLAAFGSGAAAGVLSLYGPAGWMAGGAIVGGTNAWLSGKDPLEGVVTGAITGLVGGQLGQWASGAISGVVVNGIKVASPLLQGAIIGSLSGGATGGAMSFGMALFGGANFNDALSAAGNGLMTGLVTGGISGAGGAVANSLKNGINPLTGNDLRPITSDMVKIRHHTSVENMNKIKESNFMKPSRDSGFDGFGVDFENSINFSGNQADITSTNRGAFIELTVPKSILIPNSSPLYPNHFRIMTGTGNLQITPEFRPKYYINFYIRN